ncbi:MAG: hypothetical protein KZQ88_12535 [Candidatus Thiodiazotropha sp. (ex Dulcina madagascariensis)]|nr:hypothetical protein [Candidatus Thiodiazotropha sp. (ex Dulcina madagascariensis)]MCU7926574.1 hypothetical protein [Candidatus Thiodiazotropha sp. (ex Dulcina madagascariensis)]
MKRHDEDDGWQIHVEKRLITHRSGFKAEYKDASIYGIKHFPIEATIRDIRDMVVRAEEILSRSKLGAGAD